MKRDARTTRQVGSDALAGKLDKLLRSMPLDQRDQLEIKRVLELWAGIAIATCKPSVLPSEHAARLDQIAQTSKRLATQLAGLPLDTEAELWRAAPASSVGGRRDAISTTASRIDVLRHELAWLETTALSAHLSSRKLGRPSADAKRSAIRELFIIWCFATGTEPGGSDFKHFANRAMATALPELAPSGVVPNLDEDVSHILRDWRQKGGDWRLHYLPEK